MDTTASGFGMHSVAHFVERLDHRLDEVSGAPLLSMSAAEKRDALDTFARVEAKLAALRLRLLADAESTGACTDDGAATAAIWLAVTTQQTRLATRSDLKLAQSLQRYCVVADGLAAGHVNTAQARVIVRALDALPAKGEFAVDAEQRALAEKHLVACAEHHDAGELRVLGRRLFDVICPELAEKYEGALLEAEEAAAARRTTFTMSNDGQGLCHFRGRVPERHGHMVRKALQSLTNPTRLETTTGSPIDPDLPSAVRDGIAFTQIIEAIDAHWLPSHGGVGATVVVTMTLAQLLGDLEASGVCGLDTGGHVSAGEARRLACRAGIIPVVLGGPSVVLDAGTKRRFHSEPQRVALGLRDQGCTAEGCDVPPAMCHAHHDIPYSKGGSTSVANGRLLCGHHHRRIHDPAYEHRVGDDNKVAFHRRT